MKLKIFKRTGEKKSDVRRLRFTGEIPAVIYGARRKSENIKLNEAEFQALMRDLKPGRLPTTLFELHYDKEVLKAVVRDIQYHRTNYRILHIDFGILEPDLPVTVNVPIIYQGVADCAGIKLGGFLRTVLRSIKVSCTNPNKIPSEFTIDVKNMQMTESKRLSDIPMPEGVRPLAKLSEVAVVVAKKVG